MLSVYNSHVSLGLLFDELSQVNAISKSYLKTDLRCKAGKMSTCAFILAVLITSRKVIKIIYEVFNPLYH